MNYSEFEKETDKIEQERDKFEVSNEDAVRVAIKFDVSGNIDKKNMSMRASNEKNIKELFTLQNKESKPVMHIINYTDNEGFIIVSATKKYNPILAYSEKGNFVITNDMPLGVTMWIEEIKADVDYIENNAADSIVNKYLALWKRYEDPEEIVFNKMRAGSTIDELLNEEVFYWTGQGYRVSKVGENCQGLPDDICTYFTILAEGFIYPLYDYLIYALIITKDFEFVNAVEPLLTTQWDQEFPYNNQLDPIGGQLPPLGCSAVAMGQIMAYHKWPSYYNWTDMLTYGGFSTVTQYFLKDIAISIGTKFGINGSYANIDDVASKLKNTYGYSSSISVVDHDSSTPVMQQLNLNQPVYMRGSNSANEGHAWVCDGYHLYTFYTESTLRAPTNSSSYASGSTSMYDYSSYAAYHMNWGWGGLYDGWFYYDVNPGGTSLKYKRKDIINIKK